MASNSTQNFVSKTQTTNAAKVSRVGTVKSAHERMDALEERADVWERKADDGIDKLNKRAERTDQLLLIGFLVTGITALGVAISLVALVVQIVALFYFPNGFVKEKDEEAHPQVKIRPPFN